SLGQELSERAGSMSKQGLRCRHVRQTIQQSEIVEHAIIPEIGNRNTSLIQLSAVCFTFIAQDIIFSYLNESRWQTFKLFYARPQGRRVNIPAFFRIFDVHIIHPFHQRGSEESVFSEQPV